jgi:hypothetical protein
VVRAAAEGKFRVHGWCLTEHRRTRLHHAAVETVAAQAGHRGVSLLPTVAISRVVVVAAVAAGQRGVSLRPTLPISRDGRRRSARANPAWLFLAGQ